MRWGAEGNGRSSGKINIGGSINVGAAQDLVGHYRILAFTLVRLALTLSEKLKESV